MKNIVTDFEVSDKNKNDTESEELRNNRKIFHKIKSKTVHKNQTYKSEVKTCDRRLKASRGTHKTEQIDR